MYNSFTLNWLGPPPELGSGGGGGALPMAGGGGGGGAPEEKLPKGRESNIFILVFLHLICCSVIKIHAY